MLRGLFQRKPKHERLEEEPEVRFKGLLVSERDLGYTYIPPGGKAVSTPDIQHADLQSIPQLGADPNPFYTNGQKRKE